MPNFSSFVQKCNESFKENEFLNPQLDEKLKLIDEDWQGRLKLLEKDLRGLQDIKDRVQNTFSENILDKSNTKIECLCRKEQVNEGNKLSEETCEMRPARKSPKRNSPPRKHHPYHRPGSNTEQRKSPKEIHARKFTKLFDSESIDQKTTFPRESQEEKKEPAISNEETFTLIKLLRKMIWIVIKSFFYFMLFILGLVLYSLFDPEGCEYLFDTVLKSIDRIS